MQLNEILIVLGTAHRLREPGKHSPDRRLIEAVYSREICAKVKPLLEAMGCRVIIDYEPLDLPASMQSTSAKKERSRELAMRVETMNRLCRAHGAKCVIYVSIHVNASGSDGQWHKPNGWSVFVANNGSAESKALAGCLADVAAECGLSVRKPLPTQKFWKQNIYVLRHTLCPAVLTENLFQDNIDDTMFLLSDEGRDLIAQLHVKGITNYILSL